MCDNQSLFCIFDYNSKKKKKKSNSTNMQNFILSDKHVYHLVLLYVNSDCIWSKHSIGII